MDKENIPALVQLAQLTFGSGDTRGADRIIRKALAAIPLSAIV